MNKLIKLYGERNTSTNYLSKLIKLNLEADEIPGVAPPGILFFQQILPGRELVIDLYFRLTYEHNLGWKHSRVETAERIKKCSIVKNSDVSFITLTKNPYSWLLSLYRNPYHHYRSKKQDFLTFLQTPWSAVVRDNTERVLKNPVELWNVKNSSYLQLLEINGLNFTTESLFVDPAAVIDRIHKKFSIKKISETFINYERSTKDKSKDGNYYRDYYLNEKWRKELPREAIPIINKSLDKDLMSHFGYEILS